MKQIIHILLLSTIILSCKKQNENNRQSFEYTYELIEASNKSLTFPIDENTEFVFSALFPFFDKSGKEYLTFRSQRNNSILFYDLPTGKFLFDVKLEIEGPNGVGRVNGYRIEDLNNIYVTSFSKMGLTKVDTSGIVKQFIKYGKTNTGHEVVPSFTSSSILYDPLFIYDSKLCLTQKPYQSLKASETPVSVVIHRLTKTHSASNVLC